MKKNLLLSIVMVIALMISATLVRVIDARTHAQKRVSDEPPNVNRLPLNVSRSPSMVWLPIGMDALSAIHRRKDRGVEDAHPEFFTLGDLDLTSVAFAVENEHGARSAIHCTGTSTALWCCPK